MIDLVAGPWVGEFGWELCAWQGYLRVIAPDYENVIIYGPVGHEYLYKDFATEYRPTPVVGQEPNMWLNGNTKISHPFCENESMWIPPQQLSFMPNSPEQGFIKYGKKGENGADLVYHARSLDKYGSGYMGWGDDNWKAFLSNYDGEIVCIGTKEGADHHGGLDMRGAPLEKVCDVLASAKVLVGPSSGAMHLGSLCGTPHVVWSGHARNKLRYESWWNPHKTPVRTVMPMSGPWDKKEHWQPTPIDIRAQVEDIIR